jgi:hypothetical protein
MLVNAGPTVRIRRERLSATFGQVGMFVVDWETKALYCRLACTVLPLPFSQWENSSV